MDNRETLKALVELAKKSTPGPWYAREGSASVIRNVPVDPEAVHIIQTADCFLAPHPEDETNAQFIAAARNAIPALEALLAEPASVPVSELEALPKYAADLGGSGMESVISSDDLRSLINRSHK